MSCATWALHGDGDLPHPDTACFGRVRVLDARVPALERHPRRGWRRPHTIADAAQPVTAGSLLALLDDDAAPWTAMAMVTLRARLDFLFPDNPLCWPGFLAALPAGAARQAERWLAAALRVPALGVDRAADSAATDVGLFAEICRWIDGAHAAVDRARLARTREEASDGAA